MKHKIIGQCPVCGADMKVTKLECPSCKTGVSGEFELGRFSSLDHEQLEFVEVFVKLRGNIKDVEEEMGISYPTVRKKLDEVIEAMGYRLEEEAEREKAEKRNKVLDALDEGEINYQEAVDRLENI